jgi:hypothetical protein
MLVPVGRAGSGAVLVVAVPAVLLAEALVEQLLRPLGAAPVLRLDVAQEAGQLAVA